MEPSTAKPARKSSTAATQSKERKRVKILDTTTLESGATDNSNATTSNSGTNKMGVAKMVAKGVSILKSGSASPKKLRRASSVSKSKKDGSGSASGLGSVAGGASSFETISIDPASLQSSSTTTACARLLSYVEYVDLGWKMGYDLGANDTVPFDNVLNDAMRCVERLDADRTQYFGLDSAPITADFSGSGPTTSGVSDSNMSIATTSGDDDILNADMLSPSGSVTFNNSTSSPRIRRPLQNPEDDDRDSEEDEIENAKHLFEELKRPAALKMSATRTSFIAETADALRRMRYLGGDSPRSFLPKDDVMYGDGRKRQPPQPYPFPPVPTLAKILQPRMSDVMNVTGLKLPGNTLGDENVLTICKAIRFGKLRHVEVLELSYNQLTSESVKHFAKYLLSDPPPSIWTESSEELPAVSSMYDGPELEFLRAPGSSNPSSPTTPGATSTDASAKTIQAHAAASGFDFNAPPPIDDEVNAATHVVALGLSWNDLEDEGARWMGHILGTSSFLLDLNLAHNDITPVGAEALREGMKQCSSIVSCSLAGNRVHPPVQDAINAVLLYNERHTNVTVEESMTF